MISFKIIIYLSIISTQIFSGESQYFYGDEIENMTNGENTDRYSMDQFLLTSEANSNFNDSMIAKIEPSESTNESNNNSNSSDFSASFNSSSNNITHVRIIEITDLPFTTITTTRINEITMKDINENKEKPNQDYISSTTISIDFNDQKQIFGRPNSKQATTKNSTLEHTRSSNSTSKIPKKITNVMIESITKARTIELPNKPSKSYILAYFNSTEGLKNSFKQIIILVMISIISVNLVE